MAPIFAINGYILLFLMLLASIASFYKWKLASLGTRVLCINIFINLTFDSIDFFNKVPTSVWFHQSFFLLDFTTQCLFFNYCIEDMRKRKAGFIGLGIGLMVWLGLLLYFNKNIEQSDVPAYQISLQGIINILLSLMALYFLISKEKKLPLYKQPVFWFVSGILTCFATTYFFWGFQSVIKTNQPLYHFAVIFMLIMNDVYYLALIWGYFLYKNPNPVSSIKPGSYEQ